MNLSGLNENDWQNFIYLTLILAAMASETVANPTPKSPIKSPHFSELFSCYKWRLELVFSSAIS